MHAPTRQKRPVASVEEKVTQLLARIDVHASQAHAQSCLIFRLKLSPHLQKCTFSGKNAVFKIFKLRVDSIIARKKLMQLSWGAQSYDHFFDSWWRHLKPQLNVSISTTPTILSSIFLYTCYVIRSYIYTFWSVGNIRFLFYINIFTSWLNHCNSQFRSFLFCNQRSSSTPF